MANPNNNLFTNCQFGFESRGRDRYNEILNPLLQIKIEVHI